MKSPQINSTSAASILGISPAQVLYLMRAGALKDLKTTKEGARHHEPAYALDAIMSLREKYPDPAPLLQKYYRRGHNPGNANGAARLNGCTNAKIMQSLTLIQLSIDRLLADRGITDLPLCGECRKPMIDEGGSRV